MSGFCVGGARRLTVQRTVCMDPRALLAPNGVFRFALNHVIVTISYILPLHVAYIANAD